MSYQPQQQRPERPRLPTSLNVLIWLGVGLIVALVLFVILFIVAIG